MEESITTVIEILFKEAPTMPLSIAVKIAHKILAIEREDCAKLAENHFIPGHSVAVPGFAKALADKIRARSTDYL